MATLHMSEPKWARDLDAVLAKVQQGFEIVIEKNRRPVAVLKLSPSVGPGRTIRECIALVEAYEEKLGRQGRAGGYRLASRSDPQRLERIARGIDSQRPRLGRASGPGCALSG